MLFWLTLGQFWCLLVTSVIFSSPLSNFEKNQKNPKKKREKTPKIQKYREYKKNTKKFKINCSKKNPLNIQQQKNIKKFKNMKKSQK